MSKKSDYKMKKFLPNMRNGPCTYCKSSSPEFKPEDLVRCGLCRQVAHFCCLNVSSPIQKVLGDNFFTLICRQCNQSTYDELGRGDIKLLHMLLLVLYNLHMSEELNTSDQYYHYDKHILSFIMNKIRPTCSVDCNKYFKKLKKTALTQELSMHPEFFRRKCGVKFGEGGWFQLVNVLPPAQLLQKSLIEKKSPVSRSNSPLPLDLQTSIEKNSVAIGQDGIFKEKENTPCSSYDLASSYESIDDSSSRGSWFTDKDYLRPNSLLPEFIFEDEDDSNCLVEGGVIDPSTIKVEETIKEEEDCEPPPPKKISLFGPSVKIEFDSKAEIKIERDASPCKKKSVLPMTVYEERELLAHLNKLSNNNQSIPPQLYRLKRKLTLRNEQREHNVPVFDVDKEANFLTTNGRQMSRTEKLHLQSSTTNHGTLGSDRLLDRYQITAGKYSNTVNDSSLPFRVKLMGFLHEDPPPVYSPYTLRTLKPYIFRDFEAMPLKLKLLQEIIAYPHRDDPSWQPPDRHPIDFCYVTAKHIPAINSLARQFFWSGIELSEVLQYPDFTCVVQYRGLVIGFGVIIPDVNLNEAYISFLLVHPEWQGAGIGKFMLYHLIQTCLNKDITLHVSASNPAIILYQKFGFKVEEFLNNFYDKYLPIDSTECKHAMFLRMVR